MRKLGAIFAALGMVLIMTVGCNSSGNDSSSSGSTTVSTAENLFAAWEKMHVGMSEQEVFALVGEPTDKMSGGNNRYIYTDRDGHVLTVTFTNGQLTLFTHK